MCWPARGQNHAFAGTREPSDGLEPSTPSLPCAADGNGSQRTATVSAYSRRFRADPICHRLPTVATTGLHKGSILCSLERQRVRTAAARVPSGAVGSYVALAFGSWTGANPTYSSSDDLVVEDGREPLAAPPVMAGAASDA
jgi:hypothetical protein